MRTGRRLALWSAVAVGASSLTVPEPSEVFSVLLSHPTGARITDPNASGGIISDD